MRPILAAVLTITTGTLISAQTEAVQDQTDTSAVEQVIIQTERDWNQAILAKDYRALERIIADDWTGIDFKGVTVKKAESIKQLKSGESGNTSVEVGEMKVKVYGNTAIVIGSDNEKSMYQGRDSSGKYAWIDVFVKRNGRWQVVASQSTKLR